MKIVQRSTVFAIMNEKIRRRRSLVVSIVLFPLDSFSTVCFYSILQHKNKINNLQFFKRKHSYFLFFFTYTSTLHRFLSYILNTFRSVNICIHWHFASTSFCSLLSFPVNYRPLFYSYLWIALLHISIVNECKAMFEIG